MGLGHISQLIRYFRDCAKYSNFLDRARLLTQMLLKQGFVAPSLKSSMAKLKNRLILPIKPFLLRYLVNKYYRNFLKMMKDGIDNTIRFRFKVDNCFTIMSYDAL